MVRKKPRISKAVTEKERLQNASNLMCAVMEELGYDVEDENFIGTPTRFVRYLKEFLTPYDAVKILKTDFTHITQGQAQEYKGMVVQSNIPFRTICPHHLLPILGLCHLAYIPQDRLVGISKLTRIVHAVGQQLPRMQETISDIIADTLNDRLKARGVMVVITADHACMYGRGVKVHNTPTTTSTVRGLFRDVPGARDEFFRLVSLRTR